MHLHLSSYVQVVCLFLFGCLVFFFFNDNNNNNNNNNKKTIQKQCVLVYVGTFVPLMAIETKFLNSVSLVTYMSNLMHN